LIKACTYLFKNPFEEILRVCFNCFFFGNFVVVFCSFVVFFGFVVGSY